MRATVYVHGNKESNREIGVSLGLTGEALTNFSYLAYELELEYEINSDASRAKLMKVNGRELK